VEEVGKTLERLRALAVILIEMEKMWKEIERLLDTKLDLRFLEGPPSVQFSFEKNLGALRQLPKWLERVLECKELLVKGVRVKAGCVEVWGKGEERGVAARVCLDESATLFDLLVLSYAVSEKEWDEILEAAAKHCDELREALEKLKAILAHLQLLL